MNLTKALRNFSITPFQVNDSPARERYRLALWSAVTNALSKGTGMLIVLVSIKLTLPYLGADRFGAWLTITSFAAMLAFLDMGAGNALTNNIAYAAAHDDKTKLQKSITGGVCVLFIIGLLTSIGLTLTASFLPWERIIKVSSNELYEEIRQSCTLFGGLFGIQLFSTGIQKIFSGLQKSYIANLASTISNALTLIILYLATKQEAGIYYLLLITLGCSAILNCTLVLLLIRKKLFIFQDIRKATMQLYKPLISSGGLFFLLQIGAMIGWGADALIISSTLGAAQVAIFSVTQKIFQFVSQPLSIMNTPLWAAYADAYVRKDIHFIKKTLLISLSTTAIITILLGLAIIVWSNEIVSYWTGGQLQVPLALIVAFFIWTCCECLGGAFTMFLNGCEIIKPQIYTTFTLIIISIPAKIFLLMYTGMSGMVFGFSAIYLIIVLTFYLILFRKNINIAEKINSN